jgi:hypothetical protein
MDVLINKLIIESRIWLHHKYYRNMDLPLALKLTGFLVMRLNSQKNLKGSEKKEIVCRVVDEVIEKEVDDEAIKSAMRETLSLILPSAISLIINSSKGKIILKKTSWCSDFDTIVTPFESISAPKITWKSFLLNKFRYLWKSKYLEHSEGVTIVKKIEAEPLAVITPVTSLTTVGVKKYCKCFENEDDRNCMCYCLETISYNNDVSLGVPEVLSEMVIPQNLYQPRGRFAKYSSFQDKNDQVS